MRMVLTNFDYEFRLHAMEGGLESTTWIFEPRPEPGDGVEAVREGVLATADLHRELLDRVFAEVLKGRRKPVMSGGRDKGSRDDELTVNSGYQYVGRLTWRGRRLLGRRLHRLFGEHPGDPRPDSCPGKTRYANVGLTFSGDGRPSDLHLWVSHNLSHAVNATVFRHLCGLDAFGFDDKVAARVARLDRLLAAVANGPGGGGYAVPVGLWQSSQDPRHPVANG